MSDDREEEPDDDAHPHDHRPDEGRDHDRKQGAVAGDLDLEDSDLAGEDGVFGPSADETEDADSEGPTTDEDDGEGFSIPTSREAAYDRLEAVRNTHQRRWWFTFHGTLVGLLLATFHPLGVLAGGAIVSLPQQTVRRGVLAGTVFGVVVWAVFVGWLSSVQAVAVYRQMGEIAVVTAAIPVALGFLGGLVRGLL